MHPFIANKKIFAVYLLIWTILGVRFGYLFEPSGTQEWFFVLAYSIPLFILYGAMCLSAWYICKSHPISKNSILKIFIVFIIAAFLNSTLWYIIGSGWGRLMAESLQTVRADPFSVISFQFFFPNGVLVYLLSGAGHYLVILYQETQAAQRQLIELDVLAREAELKALRSQINPHFLFNSLNSISALTSADPKAARRMTEHLAEFFRKSLEAGKKEFVPFREEIGLISHYIDIERIRFGERLAVDMQIDDGCMDFRVPPLILQPIVENAVKHGIAHLIDGGTIAVNASCRNNSLTISVANPYDPDRPRGSGNRVGLENIRDRLAAIYGSRGDVLIHQEDNTFTATITIKG
jgi:two-component system, LytTR family, sensor histidine kinase AlgZ